MRFEKTISHNLTARHRRSASPMVSASACDALKQK